MPSLYYCLSVRAGCLLTSLWSLAYSLTNTATASHHLLEIYPANRLSNQTDILPANSFNFFYKLYYKTGKKKLFGSLELFILLFTISRSEFPRNKVIINYFLNKFPKGRCRQSLKKYFEVDLIMYYVLIIYPEKQTI